MEPTVMTVLPGSEMMKANNELIPERIRIRKDFLEDLENASKILHSKDWLDIWIFARSVISSRESSIHFQNLKSKPPMKLLKFESTKKSTKNRTS